MEKLKVGEKYLRINIAGHNTIAAFKNNDRIGNQPHFKSDGVAVWVCEKQPPKTEETEEEFI